MQSTLKIQRSNSPQVFSKKSRYNHRPSLRRAAMSRLGSFDAIFKKRRKSQRHGINLSTHNNERSVII